MPLLTNQDRTSKVSKDQYSNFPFSSIGYIQSKSKLYQGNDAPKCAGTGILISDCLVLTSANNLIIPDEKNYQMKDYQALSFTLLQNQNNVEVKKSSRIKKVQINQKFMDLTSQILGLKKIFYEQQDETQKLQLHQEIMVLYNQIIQYNFALLELEQKFERRQFELYPDLSDADLSDANSKVELVVTGYATFFGDIHQLLTHSSTLASASNEGIYYDIDTRAGQSGSPVYIKGTDKLVGIHKGYQPSKKLNLGTKITKYLIQEVGKYCFNMKPQFEMVL